MIISIDPTTGVERERFAYHSRREIDTILRRNVTDPAGPQFMAPPERSMQRSAA